MRHSPVSSRPTGSPKRPRFQCYGCKRPLELEGIRRAWPADPSPEDRKHPTGQHLTTEVVCLSCRYINFLDLPTSRGSLFGLPDELAATLLAGIENEPGVGQTFSETFAYRARFWSLAERIAAGSSNNHKREEADHE